MCQITRARPLRVHGMGARLTEDMQPGMYNYGQLQIFFEDGSVGWYEAGWGPMMSETAFFVKDVIGPKGSVSIVMAETAGERALRRYQRPYQDQPDPASITPPSSPTAAWPRRMSVSRPPTNPAMTISASASSGSSCGDRRRTSTWAITWMTR